MGDFIPNLRNRGLNANADALSESIRSMQEGHSKAIELESEIKQAYANLDLNSDERVWAQEQMTNITAAVTENTTGDGSKYKAVNALVEAKGNIFSDPALMDRLKAQRDYKDFQKSIDERTDLTETHKAWAKEKNGYNYSNPFDETDENGNVKSGKFTPSVTPVQHIDPESIRKSAYSYIKPNSSTSEKLVYVDSNGKPVKFEDITNINNVRLLNTTTNQVEGITRNQLVQAYSDSIYNNPQNYNSIKQDYQVYLDDYRKRQQNGESFTEEEMKNNPLFDNNGGFVTESKYVENLIDSWSNTGSYTKSTYKVNTPTSKGGKGSGTGSGTGSGKSSTGGIATGLGASTVGTNIRVAVGVNEKDIAEKNNKLAELNQYAETLNPDIEKKGGVKIDEHTTREALLTQIGNSNLDESSAQNLIAGFDNYRASTAATRFDYHVSDPELSEQQIQDRKVLTAFNTENFEGCGDDTRIVNFNKTVDQLWGDSDYVNINLHSSEDLAIFKQYGINLKNEDGIIIETYKDKPVIRVSKDAAIKLRRLNDPLQYINSERYGWFKNVGFSRGNLDDQRSLTLMPNNKYLELTYAGKTKIEPGGYSYGVNIKNINNTLFSAIPELEESTKYNERYQDISVDVYQNPDYLSSQAMAQTFSEDSGQRSSAENRLDSNNQFYKDAIINGGTLANTVMLGVSEDSKGGAKLETIIGDDFDDLRNILVDANSDTQVESLQQVRIPGRRGTYPQYTISWKNEDTRKHKTFVVTEGISHPDQQRYNESADSYFGEESDNFNALGKSMGIQGAPNELGTSSNFVISKDGNNIKVSVETDEGFVTKHIYNSSNVNVAQLIKLASLQRYIRSINPQSKEAIAASVQMKEIYQNNIELFK